jgi:hypothetical protein
MQNRMISASRVFSVILLVLCAGGCASTEFFKQLDAEHFQHQHRTRLVVFNHAALKYYWQEVYGSSAYPREVRRETFEQWVPPVWQPTAKEELDSVEPAYRSFPPVLPVSGEIYQRTTERAFSASRFLSVQKGIMAFVDTVAPNLAPSDTILPYSIPVDDIAGVPDWYLILHVRDMGLMRMGIHRGSGLAGALAAALTTAISEKHWSLQLNSVALLADARTKQILWKNVLFFQVPLKGSLQEILDNHSMSLAKGIVEGMSYSVSIHSAALLGNKQANASDSSVTRLLFSRGEIDSMTTRLMGLTQ